MRRKKIYQAIEGLVDNRPVIFSQKGLVYGSKKSLHFFLFNKAGVIDLAIFSLQYTLTLYLPFENCQ